MILFWFGFRSIKNFGVCRNVLGRMKRYIDINMEFHLFNISSIKTTSYKYHNGKEVSWDHPIYKRKKLIR
jgi:hypothetical protein